MAPTLTLLDELEMQNLEPLEAPGFWSGFKQGLVIASLVAAGAALAT